MRIQHVLAVLPVSDLDRAGGWYQRLFDRPPDNKPMDTLIEWRATDTGWFQVFSGTENAGTGYANLAVDDLDKAYEELQQRGVSVGPINDASKGVRTMAITDPDGNTITLIGGFRVVY